MNFIRHAGDFYLARLLRLAGQAIGSQVSNKSFGQHTRSQRLAQLTRHRSFMSIDSDLRERQALGEAAAAENHRIVSAAHRRNALLEFGTDQIDRERIQRMQNPIKLSVLILNPKRNLTTSRTMVSLGLAVPGFWIKALTL